MADMTATSVYGYATGSGYDNPVTENMGNANPTYSVTQNQATGMTVAGIPAGHSSYGHQNPLFWVLVLALLVTGYLGFGFDFNLKNVLSTRTRVGRE